MVIERSILYHETLRKLMVTQPEVVEHVDGISCYICYCPIMGRHLAFGEEDVGAPINIHVECEGSPKFYRAMQSR